MEKYNNRLRASTILHLSINTFKLGLMSKCKHFLVMSH